MMISQVTRSERGAAGVLAVEVGDFELAREVSEWIELLGVAAIVIAVIAAFVAAIRAVLDDSASDWHEVFKWHLARGMLIGLDLLIAADIIRTVTLQPTLENVSVLGLIVLVRTFLAWSLVLETENRWPWQRPPKDRPTAD